MIRMMSRLWFEGKARLWQRGNGWKFKSEVHLVIGLNIKKALVWDKADALVVAF